MDSTRPPGLQPPSPPKRDAQQLLELQGHPREEPDTQMLRKAAGQHKGGAGGA